MIESRTFVVVGDRTGGIRTKLGLLESAEVTHAKLNSDRLRDSSLSNARIRGEQGSLLHVSWSTPDRRGVGFDGDNAELHQLCNPILASHLKLENAVVSQHSLASISRDSHTFCFTGPRQFGPS